VRGVEVVDDQEREDAEDAGGAVTTSAAAIAPGIPAVGVTARALGDRDVDASEVGVARGAGEASAARRRRRARLRRAPERGGDRRFVPGAHLDRVADEPADAAAAALDEARRGVAHVEGPAERRGLRGERLDFAFGGVQPLRRVETSFSAAVASRCARS
jgi:hypothetical protein